MTEDDRKLVLEVLDGNQWGCDQAFADKYCRYCCMESDYGIGQTEHRLGCKWVAARSIVALV
jgi:hypothetical protein